MNAWTVDELLKKRFWSKVKKGTDGECWEWQASVAKSGYGQFMMPKTDEFSTKMPHGAHRISWLLEHGFFPESSQYICHHCDNRKCVNPRHLFLGDAKANNQDRINKNRSNYRKHENHHRAKLCADDVRQIKVANKSHRALAIEFNVGKTTIESIRNGTTWRGLA